MKQKGTFHNNKGSIHLEDTKVRNVIAPNQRVPPKICEGNLTEMKEEINISATAGDFNSSKV